VVKIFTHPTYRDARYGEILGAGSNADAHHITAPSPGGVGAIVSTIAAGARDTSSYQGTLPDVYDDPSRLRDRQAGLQIAGLGVSIGFALVGGAIGGLMLAVMPVLPAFFDDVYEYLVPDDQHGTVTVTLQKVNEPVSGAPHGDVATTVAVSRSANAPTTWSFTNAPSATQHGATLFQARPLVLSASDAPAAVRPYGAVKSEDLALNQNHSG